MASSPHMATAHGLPPLVLTMGEPAGIGGEITAKAWQALRKEGPVFAYLGEPALLGDVPHRLISWLARTC